MGISDLKLLYSKEGILESCKINDQSLHSKYNPHQEAIRVFKQQKLDSVKKETRIILIGAALHYDIEAIRELCPDTCIIAIYFHKELATHSIAEYPIHYNIDSFQDREQFFLPALTHALHDSLVSTDTDISVCYWPSSMRIWTHHCQQCLTQVQESLLLYLSEKNTARHFLPQWIRNSCHHFVHILSSASVTMGTKPSLVCAAGPSLNFFLTEIQSMRDAFCLISLSSSLNCLYHHSIIPDVVVHQDASYYAQRQLHYYFDEKKSLLAMPLSAGRIPRVSHTSPLLINTQQEMEQLMPYSEGVKMSPYATVLGTALELASILSTSSIFLVGADMSIDCCSSHCIPHCNTDMYATNYTHSFEHILHQDYLNYEHTLKQTRHGYPLKQNTALINYAAWFSRWKSKIKSRIIQFVPPNEHSLLGMNTSYSIRDHIQKQKIHLQTNMSSIATPRRGSEEERKTLLQEHITQWKQLSYRGFNEEHRHTTPLVAHSPHSQKASSTEQLQRLISQIMRYIGKERWYKLVSHIQHSVMNM